MIRMLLARLCTPIIRSKILNRLLQALLLCGSLFGKVEVGIDRLIEENLIDQFKGKKIALLTNHTAISATGKTTLEILSALAKEYRVIKVFSPEHGLYGDVWAEEAYSPDGKEKTKEGIPIFSLYGKTRRPTDEMLRNVDLIVYDIQDIGSRSYTYITSLFYLMEACAKKKIPIWVLDRPNPINGVTIDGPMLNEKLRSFVGYINVPYCHGMTIGELARFFNGEYKIGAVIKVVEMKGWRRRMSFKDTGLEWIPTSPNIPEPTTPLYYPMTGILGELGIVSIGIGYTLPFKVVGAPWIKANEWAENLQKLKLPGVLFRPFHFCPFTGKFSKKKCQGVLIQILDPLIYKPVTTQYAIIDSLKKMYPTQFQEGVCASQKKESMFNLINGTRAIYEKVITPSAKVSSYIMMGAERTSFEEKRKKYLLPYQN